MNSVAKYVYFTLTFDLMLRLRAFLDMTSANLVVGTHQGVQLAWKPISTHFFLQLAANYWITVSSYDN